MKILALFSTAKFILGRLWRTSVLRFRGVKVGSKLWIEGMPELSCPECVTMRDCLHLGKSVSLLPRHGAVLNIGANTYIGNHTTILASLEVSIGSDCLIAPMCHITDTNHGIGLGELIRLQPVQTKSVRIGCDVWLGSGVSVLPGVTIGDGAIIGARAVVTSDIPPNAVAVGVPARIIHYRT